MSNLVEEQKYLEWQIYNLSRSAFQGKVNKGRDRQLAKLREDLSKIKAILFPRKKRY